MQAGSKQLLLIAGAVLLTATLYFAPQKNKKEDHSETPGTGFSFEAVLSEAKGQLKRQEVDQIDKIEESLKSHAGSAVLLDSLGKMWDKQNAPQVSAVYFEQIAEANPTEKNWLNAAFRYYDAFRLISDSAYRKMYVDKAISSYKKVLAINPNNLNAKTDLGICYAEGTSSPMEGIMMLREVVKENPNHEMAQYNLGILSVKSSQYEKAVERFEKVLEINPTNKEARFLLGRTFLMMGKKDLALKNLEMIRETENSRLNQEVNNLINQINNN